jgi:putative transposase
VVDDKEALLTFYDYPAEHWIHLRTTNPIESTFSPVRARTRVTKGLGSKDAGLAMVFKLLEAAEQRWRVVNGPHLVALVRAGARFENPSSAVGEHTIAGNGTLSWENKGRALVRRVATSVGVD